MTSFINIEYAARHQGADRFESAVEAVQQARHYLTDSRGLATLLLSAVTAAVMVVAYQVMDSMAEGHLLAMWMGLWLAAFAALALFSGATRQLAARSKSSLDAWARNRALVRADERLWAMARQDSRLMADLQAMIMRGEEQNGTDHA